MFSSRFTPPSPLPPLAPKLRFWAVLCMMVAGVLAAAGAASAQTMSVGHLIYNDANGNGHFDDGEGAGGVTVQIWLATGDPNNPYVLQDTQTTASDGTYLFQGLATGTYHVTVAASNFDTGGPLAGFVCMPFVETSGDASTGQKGLFNFSPASNGISTADFSVAPGFGPGGTNSDLTQDIGAYYPLGIGNVVFADTNSNGVADPGEGVPGVDVQLYNAGDTPGVDPPLGDLLTDLNGQFLFGGLQAGSYKLYIPASQFQVGGPLTGALSVAGTGNPNAGDDGNDDGIDDPHPEVNGIVSVTVALSQGVAVPYFTANGEVDLTVDFGFVLPSGKVGVGNLVFIDANGNGHYDDGEGAGGVTVQLFAQGQNPLTDTPVASVVTAGDGSYLISDLDPGSYFLFVPPSQFAVGQPLFSALSVPGTQAGDDELGEKGIDVPYPEVSGVQTAVFTLAVGTEPTDADIELGYNAASDDFQDANVDLTQDFGFVLRAMNPVSVGNLVFVDANNNGHYDAGEGVAGVQMQLFHEGDDPNTATPVASQLSGSDGDYYFGGLTPGRYFVHVAAASFATGQPLAGLLSIPGNGGDDGNDDDVDENGIDSANPWVTGISSVVITLAENTEPLDFPYGTETGFRAKQDDDFDGNGNMTIDFGFVGGCPTLTVLPATVAGGTVGANFGSVSYTVTGTSGTVVWSITAGALPAGLTLSSQGLLSGVPSQAGNYNFTVSATTGGLCQGSQAYSMTIAPATGNVGVGNAIYFDANGNGVMDSGEGVDGVLVQLFNEGDNPQTATPLASTVTAGGGLYLFSNLFPGRYFIHIPTSQFSIGAPLQDRISMPGVSPDNGVDDNVVGNDKGIDAADPTTTGISSIVFALAPGTEPVNGPAGTETGVAATEDDFADSNYNLTIDLAFVRSPQTSVSVGNQVFKDANGNGSYDPGEGVDGVTVQLFAAGADPLSTSPLESTVTANGGRYSFTGLAGGSYFVFIPASNFAGSGALAGLLSDPGVGPANSLADQGIDAPAPATSGISSVVVSPVPGGALASATVDLGFYDPSTPVIGVGNLVFVDWNHNGRYDAGEEAAGVVVQLFAATADPLTDTPLTSTVTDAQGAYLLTTNVAGDYFVFVPPSEFANGKPLNDCFSMTGNGSDSAVDDDRDENGIDSPHPEVTGIRTVSIHLQAGTEPTDATGETGFEATSDDANDANFNLTVDFGFDPSAQPFLITPPTLPPGALGIAYNQALTASGGTAPYTWAIASGALPDGVVLGSDGSLSGAASAEGTFNFVVTVADAGGFQAAASYQVMIGAPPTVGVGNAIYVDANHNGVLDSGEGAAGVVVQLFNAGDDPLSATPLQQTITSSLGLYSFDGLNAGAYFIYIPASQFAIGGPLFGLISIPGVSGDDGVDDNLPNNDNGIDSPHPELTGISSIVFNLQPGTEPVDGGTETGFHHADDNAEDANFNATIDLGFQTPCPTITVTPPSLPPATAGFAYSQAFLASGGVGPVVFSIAAGALPAGFQLSVEGVLSGTTTALGVFPFTVQAMQGDGCSSSLITSLAVNGPLGVGNLVFFDANGNGHADAGEGVDGVTVELYHSTDTPGATSPISTTVTAGGGFYLFDGLPPGAYLLHVPSAMFAPGAPLWAMKSVSGAMISGDDDVGEKGLDAVDPTATGISTAVFTLAAGTEPTDATGETGLGGTADNARDADVDLTQDFGFVDVAGLPATFADWATANGLSGGSGAPLGSADGDAFSNLMKYALGMNPSSGGNNPGAAFTVTKNGTSGKMDVTLHRRHGGEGDLTYTLQVLPTLNGAAWTTSAVTPTIVDNGDGTETLTFSSLDNDPALVGSNYGFVRILVSLDANHDGVPEATDTSPILGWQHRALAVQNQTYAVPFVLSPVFTGTVGAVAGNALDVTTSVGTGNFASLLTAGLSYYVEVMAGNNQGQRWEVDAANSSATGIALLPGDAHSTQNTVPASLVGDLIAVRPHWRVADLFPPATYHATNNASTADQILVWDSAGGGYVTLWLANYFSQAHWHKVGDAVLTDTEDNRIIGPCDGLFARPKLSAVNASAMGQLRTWKVACPLVAGANFVGNPFPVGQSPLDRSMTFANGFTASTNPVNADRIYFWNGDAAPTTGYTTYHLLKQGSLEIWKIVGSTDLTTNYGTQTLFMPGTAAFINSIQGKPDWVIPAPSIP